MERYNGCIKAGFRRLKAALPEGEWYEFLPDVLAGLRMLPSSLGLSPFLVAHKQEPHWPAGERAHALVVASHPGHWDSTALVSH